jgi:diguanylate cyclase (GGDEF)-like protein
MKKRAKTVRRAKAGSLGARRDAHTGFYALAPFREVLFIEVKRARRYGLPLALALLQLDPVPEGMARRENLMVGLGRAIRGCLRDTDLPVQYSKDRVLLVMTHTQLPGALTVCQRICERVAKAQLAHRGRAFRPTVSAGVCAAATPGKVLSVADLVRHAQASLARALSAGGNRVEFYDRADVRGPPSPEDEALTG